MGLGGACLDCPDSRQVVVDRKSALGLHFSPFWLKTWLTNLTSVLTPEPAAEPSSLEQKLVLTRKPSRAAMDLFQG